MQLLCKLMKEMPGIEIEVVSQLAEDLVTTPIEFVC